MADFLDTNGLRLLWEKIKALVLGKADKVANATSGNFASLDSDGNIEDSGYSSVDFVSSADLSDTPKVIVPSVDGTIQNMTNEEISSLRIGDCIKEEVLSGKYRNLVVFEINNSDIYCSLLETPFLLTYQFKKTNGVWAYYDYVTESFNYYLKKKTIQTSTSSTVSLSVVNNIVYNCTTALASLSIIIAVLPTADFSSQVNFISGSTATTFTTPSSTHTILWRGDDVTSGVFVPVADRRYVISFYGDGTYAFADVNGYAVN